MSNKTGKMLLVGDNPFHGISHLSQERARVRGPATTNPEFAAHLVVTSLQNSATGFMFSVSETTLSVLRTIRELTETENLRLHVMMPYAYEYVRLATQIGTYGLAKKFARAVVASGNIGAIATGLRAVIRTDPIALLKAYLIYEISRVKSAIGKQASLDSILLNEVVADMALALDMDWLFRSFIDFVSDMGIKPGFNTRNFVYFVNRFKDWNLDLREVLVVTPFNNVGFQMNPSKEECEKVLADMPESNVIAISILASGYLKLPAAVAYLRNLSNLKGVAVGVSKEQHARETFKLLKAGLEGGIYSSKDR